ncbi:sensor histidine kinase [Nocardioides aurantiacus]|uniref:histidine kinase n=1 Tax=Nocardioides aurantiacus TaxID=86796 RepID=A0A3N2CSD6_9ACTN|nr:histidine kinase [Nocardioides aurantiacus]ROR90154.1 two-component system sensor histidine kinase DesK [Nocardioides aurantiacus]
MSRTLPLHVPGWSGRSDVARVDLYTRGSLYAVAWFLLAMGLLAAGARLGDTSRAAVAGLACLVLGVLATLVLRHGLDVRHVGHHRGAPDVPWRLLLPMVAVSSGLWAWALALPGAESGPLVVIAFGSLAFAVGALATPRLHAGVLGAAAVAAYVASGSLGVAVYALGISAFFLFTVQSSLWLLGVVTELDRGRRHQAALAVAEERLRFSRDVHDVLGRRLSTIAVQAELAATLARRGDERAAGRILEVRATAHDALREARELARGYRPLDLRQELDGAVSLLRSAGIACDADLADLPDAWHEPAARVVREAVTNVLRHSTATHVRIRCDATGVEVSDDGGPAAAAPGDGSGLRTLAVDLAPLGARLESGSTGAGFTVRLLLQDDSPQDDAPRGETPASTAASRTTATTGEVR